MEPSRVAALLEEVRHYKGVGLENSQPGLTSTLRSLSLLAVEVLLLCFCHNGLLVL